MGVEVGLERVVNNNSLQKSIKGQIGLLAHNASITHKFEWGPLLLKKIFGNRLTTLFGPQHGLSATVQDNMIETDHFYHPFLQLKVYSLYGKTRWPTDEMLEGLNTIIVDLQDVGTRVYTYIYTLTYLMEACGRKGIDVVVLDRPNPAGGEIVEGNLLDLKFQSFVGRHPLPMRHSLTIGEVAKWAQKFIPINCSLAIIPMEGWKRQTLFNETGIPWVNPSPNLSHPDSAYSFPATVLFEGTNISEGRGTTRALELVGHPQIEPFSLLHQWEKELHSLDMGDFVLRPHYFMPTFHKFMGENCGGWQIHPLNRQTFRPWRLGQWLTQKLYHTLGEHFSWKKPPYEYEYQLLPIDVINGTDKLRLWVEKKENFEQLLKFENEALQTFLPQREDILLY